MRSISHIPPHQPWYETPIGWASERGGTTGRRGGEKPEFSYYVRNIEELRSALEESCERTKRIWIG